jgi:hypothetical protein
MNESTQSFTGFVGILLQLAGSVLAGGLLFLLRAHAARRYYFKLWSPVRRLARSPGTPAA